MKIQYLCGLACVWHRRARAKFRLRIWRVTVGVQVPYPAPPSCKQKAQEGILLGLFIFHNASVSICKGMQNGMHNINKTLIVL